MACRQQNISIKSHRDFGEIKTENVELNENYGNFRNILRCPKT